MPIAAITPDLLLSHWQGHRRLTRRVITAFPEDRLFSYSIGGMRSFGEMSQELLGMALPTVEGVVTGSWHPFQVSAASTKDEILAEWDTATTRIDELWPEIPADAWQKEVAAFGAHKAPVWEVIAYAVDNEIHHRGEGYVYLRSLGIEPPAFYLRH